MSRITLPEPVEVAKFFKNRRKDVIVVSLSSYEGHNLVLRLPDLAKAVNKAMEKAKELGLLDDGGANE